ncbi:response regulator transcription factor [Ramlibacter terrae]|uniref:Response regulator transcription factor n=1 Tax=Ramlibacter terrae TaxID=2732511 RepID=A0ABX6P1J1_9BURK|nr:response regulator transcription factor [Ramlibacter terrae]
MSADEAGAPRVKRILLVDDELSSAEVLALILAGEGYQSRSHPTRARRSRASARRRPTCSCPTS